MLELKLEVELVQARLEEVSRDFKDHQLHLAKQTLISHFLRVHYFIQVTPLIDGANLLRAFHFKL